MPCRALNEVSKVRKEVSSLETKLDRQLDSVQQLSNDAETAKTQSRKIQETVGVSVNQVAQLQSSHEVLHNQSAVMRGVQVNTIKAVAEVNDKHLQVENILGTHHGISDTLNQHLEHIDNQLTGLNEKLTRFENLLVVHQSMLEQLLLR